MRKTTANRRLAKKVDELIDYELSFHQSINETRKTKNGS